MWHGEANASASLAPVIYMRRHLVQSRARQTSRECKEEYRRRIYCNTIPMLRQS